MAKGVGSQVLKQERMSDALACLDMNRGQASLWSFFSVIYNVSLADYILSVFSRALEDKGG